MFFLHSHSLHDDKTYGRSIYGPTRPTRDHLWSTSRAQGLLPGSTAYLYHCWSHLHPFLQLPSVESDHLAVRQGPQFLPLLLRVQLLPT